MDWHLSPVAQWIDRKVIDLNFAHTVVFIGAWIHHEENVKILSEKGLSFYWWGRSSNPYSQDVVPLYFVGVSNLEQGNKCQETFKEIDNLCYARFYNGHKAIKAIRKKKSE